MRVLVLCNHGNVRSVGLGYIIKRIYTHDVLTAGVEENTTATISMLAQWADKVIALTKEAKSLVPGAFFIDIGEDVWHNPFHHNLQHRLLKEIGNLHL